ncbi:hypothetical protein [Acinetobacter baumannii]|uniref:hypothetical protein n=1 Tax=Acinetobacter baumannii TaxID=470 RepID=UPI003D6CF39D
MEFLKFLNHLCDEERCKDSGWGMDIFLNHLCDEERKNWFKSATIQFLNHLCDEEPGLPRLSIP